ncbi:putative tail fiber protein [Escherichia phage JLBYU28]|uniref:Tail fiber protein n=1 Tax=Escherichia phage JLBYU28 TaxID=2894744 RepID=A0AAE9CFF6_9CAUD|nr:putative tail fiber protein [Escherichia phage JLBYU28]
MADYKLSELNSIDTIRSDDLLHVRVKKRPEMLGDEDRRMTYQDFLASFKLERFVQIAGSTMTGDLGIVKLLYGGKAVFDPTGSSEITMGDVLKTFKINANGLKLTIADASRSATVYHTLNKPSPNELGMRTNEENDARYARLAVTNTFSGTQQIQGDANLLRLRNQNANNAQYIEGVDLDGSARWWVGIGRNGGDTVNLYNNKYDSALTVASNISVNKSLVITGQVQPSDFSNLDDRYFTQTVANQRFAQLAGDNTFTGANTFTNLVVKKNANALTLQNTDASTPLYILGKKSDGTNKWYVGTDSEDTRLNIYNYLTGSRVSLGTTIGINKTVQITGQVQPSDFSNIDSRYIPAATLSTIARTNTQNTFNGAQTVVSDGEGLVIKNSTQSRPLYIRGKDAANASRWWVGVGGPNSTDVALNNSFSGTQLILGNSTASINKTLTLAGQIQPSDFSNLDARYFTQSASDSRYLRIGSTNFNNGDDEKWAKIATVVMPQSASTAVIEVFGGSGFNYGVLDQACKTEIVLRTGNGSPKGLNIVAWKNSKNPIITDIGSVNTSGDTYDIYCKVGAFQNGTTSRVQYTSNAGVQLFGVPQTFDDAPQGIVKGTIAKYYTNMQKPTPSDIGAYTKAETDQKIAQAVSDSTDLNKIYPVGIVTWFNSNVNPNTALPGLTWTYLNNGVGRTIRIAAANGSDVATTGGSDSVTLAVGNLPSHTHSFSATTSSFDYGTKTTNTTGAHTHSVSGSTNTTGNHTHTIYRGNARTNSETGKTGFDNPSFNGTSGAAGNHSHTVSGTAASNGNHAHTVGIGAHSHTVSGNTGGTGSGSAFSVTNQFYKLMAWVRTA